MTSLGLAIPGLLFVTLCYVALCAVSPFGNCRKCRGYGFTFRTDWRGRVKTDRKGRPKPGPTCRRCHGDRIRIRVGRHWWNTARRIHRKGTQPAASQKGTAA
ncbi:hypothetical protein [Streptomyces sp. ODS28]|uniref:hypothetical protein n=1 Tax=Streptomyces sp. ODS28 TaxID=3136688 RepID=UPI0031EE8665